MEFLFCLVTYGNNFNNTFVSCVSFQPWTSRLQQREQQLVLLIHNATVEMTHKSLLYLLTMTIIYRDRRDQLRLGVDRACSDLVPSLTVNMPTLRFVPGCLREGAEDVSVRTVLPDRYVVGK